VTDVRAVGIDLGARALHLVVVEGPAHGLAVVDTAVVLPDEVATLTEVCAGAAAIAIDAPSDPSIATHAGDESLSPKFRVARCGEIALGQQHRCWVPWVTPRADADTPGWMQVGYRAWSGLRDAGHGPIEVYPSGAFTALAGARLPKKSTPAGLRARIDLLGRFAEFPTSAADWGHDTIDATVAALIAAWRATDGPVVAARHDHVGEDGSAIWIPST